MCDETILNPTMKFLILVFLISGMTVACSSNNSSGNTTKTDIIKTDAAPTRTVNRLWLGKWERRRWQNDASLEITNIQNDSIKFSLSASSGGHTGELEGMAIVNGHLAIFSNREESGTCLIQFKLIGDSTIVIDQKRGYCFAGMGVTYDGDYKSSKGLPEAEPTENLISLGIFKTKKDDSIFKALVGNSYALFVNSTQLTSEDDDLDSLNAAVRSSGVRGLFTSVENIIMTDSLNNIWAAVIDDNKVYYFTNKKEYKERLPKTIDSWRQRFRGYPIIYK
jgi:hypothetical protein